MMPIVVVCFFFMIYKDKIDLQQSVLSVTLALGFNGLITDILKLIVGMVLSKGLSVTDLHQISQDKIYSFNSIWWLMLFNIKQLFHHTHYIFLGRPRPDFFWRCFPDGQMNPGFKCTGDPVVIRDGKKSFPSGHSSCTSILYVTSIQI